MSKIADVTQSFRKYLDTQKDYFDYLRKRPRFFLSTHYVDKRLTIVKTSVEEARKEEEGGGRRRRKPDKQPVKQPVKQPQKEFEEQIPERQPVDAPLPLPLPIVPPVRTPTLDRPTEQPVETPAPPVEVPAPDVEPIQIPAPPIEEPDQIPVIPELEPIQVFTDPDLSFEIDEPKTEPIEIETPAFNLEELLSRGPGNYTKAEEKYLIDEGYDDWVRGGQTASPLSDVAGLIGTFFLVKFGLGAAPTATGVTGASKIVPFLKSGAVNKIVPFIRSTSPLVPKPFSYGGIASGPTFSLAGERTTELALPQGKINEFINALYREAGSISVGIAESVARQVGADSATMSMVSKLKSIFGAAKGFEVGGINIPGQIPVIDTADPEVEQRGVKNMFQRAISFGKNIAKSVVPIAVAAAGGVLSAGAAQAHHEEPLSAAPVMVPEYDPTMQGAQITPKGSTDTDNISGYPITSRYGPRWGRLHGGIDVGVPTGTAIGLNVPGEIVFAGTAGGYGYVIDAWVPSLGAQFRLAHLSRFFKKSGTFTAGEALGETGGAKGHPGAGSSTGPHLHYEIDTTKGGSGYGGARDPELLSKLSKHIMMGSMSQGTGEEETEGEGGQEFTYNSKEKTSELDIVRQQTTKTLERSRVNSIVEIPIPGPTSYTPQLTTVMREKSPKRPYIISPFSKGVDQ